MRFVSVCSGVEAASLALEPLGFEAAAFSEVDPFCCSLLEQRFPGVPNLGDLTKWRDWDLPKAEMLIGGTPCQSFSVAGKRESLSDDRGNLALNFVELFHAGGFDCALWENVPGVLNTKDNAFGCFLGGLVGADGPLCEPPDGRWPSAGMASGPRSRIAWRVLDAQYFRVAQRRRRVFVVASASDRIDPSKILFEPQSVQGHSSPGREARTDVAGTLTASLGERGSPDAGSASGNNSTGPIDVATTLNSHGGPNGRCDYESETFVTHALTAEGFDASEDGTGRGTPIVPIPFDPIQITSGENRSNPQPGQACHTLPADSQAPAIAYGGAVRGRDEGAQLELEAELSPALRASNGGSSRAIAFDARQQDVCVYGEQSGTLDQDGWTNAVMQHGVRRLMPVECERLQGMPDNWTAITYRGKPAADGNRYKAVGNSFAVPVVRWIGGRILAAASSRSEAA